jgi:hypothetical protein
MKLSQKTARMTRKKKMTKNQTVKKKTAENDISNIKFANMTNLRSFK